LLQSNMRGGKALNVDWRRFAPRAVRRNGPARKMYTRAMAHRGTEIRSTALPLASLPVMSPRCASHAGQGALRAGNVRKPSAHWASRRTTTRCAAG